MATAGALMERIQLEVPFDSPFDSAFDALRHDIHTSGIPVKYIEAELGKPPGWLSRRLSDNPNDPDVSGDLRLKDAEKIMDIIKAKRGQAPTGLPHYLINKYLRQQEADDLQALRDLRPLLPDLKRIIAVMERTDSTQPQASKRNRA